MKKQNGINQLVKVISFAGLMLCIVIVMNSCGGAKDEKAAEKMEVKDSMKMEAPVTDSLKQPVDSSKDILNTGGNKPQ
jgi:hypothetical protein